MAAFRSIVGRARAATVIQKHIRGQHARKKVTGVRANRDWAWNLYRNTPSATENVYKRLKDQKLRVERTQDRTVAMSLVHRHPLPQLDWRGMVLRDCMRWQNVVGSVGCALAGEAAAAAGGPAKGT